MVQRGSGGDAGEALSAARRDAADTTLTDETSYSAEGVSCSVTNVVFLKSVCSSVFLALFDCRVLISMTS